MSKLEIIGVIVSFVGIWLTAKRLMLCWPVSLLAVVLYTRIFYDARLYSDMLLQVLFGISIIYGWVLWRQDEQASGDIIVAPVTIRALAAWLLAGAVGSVAVGYVMAHYTNAALPWVDSTLSSFSLVAQFWTARRYIANWWLWIVVDLIYVGMFVFKALYLTAGLYAALCGLAVVGLRNWQKAAKKQHGILELKLG